MGSTSWSWGAGHTLGSRYRLQRKVADGSTGPTFEGHDLALDRTVVIKGILPEYGAPEVAAANAERLRRAQAVSAAGQDPLLDAHFGAPAREDGEPQPSFVVRKWINGDSLRKRLDAWSRVERRLSPDEVRVLISEIVGALEGLHPAAAHSNLTPTNIFFVSGATKFTDPLRLVGGGEVPSYIAPELAAPSSMPSPASDVWSLGLIAGELLVGRPTRPGESLLEAGASVPLAVDELYRMATIADPRRRPATPGLFANQLHRAIEGQEPSLALGDDTHSGASPPAPEPSEEEAELEPTRALPQPAAAAPPAPPSRPDSLENWGAHPDDLEATLIDGSLSAESLIQVQEAARAMLASDGADAPAEPDAPSQGPTPTGPLSVPGAAGEHSGAHDVLDWERQGWGEPLGSPAADDGAGSRIRHKPPTLDGLRVDPADLREQARQMAALKRRREALARAAPQQARFHEAQPTMDVSDEELVKAARFHEEQATLDIASASVDPSVAAVVAEAARARAEQTSTPRTGAGADSASGSRTWLIAAVLIAIVAIAAAAIWLWKGDGANEQSRSDDGQRVAAAPVRVAEPIAGVAPAEDSAKTAPSQPDVAPAPVAELQPRLQVRADVAEPSSSPLVTAETRPPPATTPEALRRPPLGVAPAGHRSIDRRLRPPPTAVPDAVLAAAMAAPSNVATSANRASPRRSSTGSPENPSSSAKAARIPPKRASRGSSTSRSIGARLQHSPKRKTAATPPVAWNPDQCPSHMKRIERTKKRRIAGRVVSEKTVFCIDTHEYPGKGRAARTAVSWNQAVQLCSQAGKRLCTSREWATACGAGVGVQAMMGSVAEWTFGRKVHGVDPQQPGVGTSCGSSSRRDGATTSATVGFRCCADPG